ncbi:RagB/SusD family nutrient uptake outer membrane protein [Alistipes sp.]|uniref:RagB/SusD family nutrient uptake outer membrane protein n=1 Tax=Alistipes sp. TaxID=1872444 RepID=UPI003AF10135
MKRLLKYLVALLLLSGLAACEDFLDKESYTDHDREILRTPEGIEALLDGVYDIFQHTNYYGRNLMAYEAAKGNDFFVRVSSGNNFERENRYAESTASAGAAEGMWLKIYSGIRTATDLIEAVPGVEGMPEKELRRVEGEAHALRGLAYFDLMRLFAYPPRFSFPDGEEYDIGPTPGAYAWGVPILWSKQMADNILDYEVRRETAVTVYDYIEHELLEAKRLLADAEPRQGHVNYVAVCGLLARMYLYMERWDEVIEQGGEALRSAAGTYRMIPYDTYKTTYYKPFNSENLWELVYTLSDNNGGNSLNYLVRKPTYDNPGAENDGQVSQAVGYAAYGLFPATVALLTADPDDVRGYWVCDLGIANKPYKGLRKYVGESYHYVYNQPVIRLPEVCLSLAEAYLRKDGGSVALAEPWYNVVREARVKRTGFVSADVEGALAEVFAERRRELMLEGHNYWDYFRRGETMKRPELLENANKITVAFGYGSAKSQARKQVVYPIPLSELEANKAIRDQQNPGYETYDEVYQTE